MHKCREGGRIANVAKVVAVGVNAVWQREILGVDVFTAEDGAAWLAFLRSLVARGLSGVRLVTSDAHAGLVAAIASVYPGASWQRCRMHFYAQPTDARAKVIPGHGGDAGPVQAVLGDDDPLAPSKQAVPLPPVDR